VGHNFENIEAKKNSTQNTLLEQTGHALLKCTMPCAMDDAKAAAETKKAQAELEAGRKVVKEEDKKLKELSKGFDTENTADLKKAVAALEKFCADKGLKSQNAKQMVVDRINEINPKRYYLIVDGGKKPGEIGILGIDLNK